MFNPIVRSSFLGEFDSIFNTIKSGGSRVSVYTGQIKPQANVSKDDTGFQISLAAPGLSRGDFNIEVSDSVLTISAESDYEKNENSLKQEYSYHNFSRSWSLPETACVDNITAEYVAGVLSLNIPVEDVIINKTKKIEVN